MRVILYTDLRILPLSEWQAYIEGIREYLECWEPSPMPDEETIKEMAHETVDG